MQKTPNIIEKAIYDKIQAVINQTTTKELALQALGDQDSD
jgi:hypothetical protein